MKIKKILTLILTGALAVSLVACGADDKKTEDKKTVIKVVATSTPHAEMLEEIRPLLKADGYDLKVTISDDYALINRTVVEKSADANFSQHVPYLETYNKENKTELVAGAKIHIEPMGAYSKKIKSVDELKDGDEILIPSDGSNGARALQLLEKQGLIKLKDVPAPSKLDIIENKKNLKITESDAAQLPRQLEDVAIAVINTNYAIQGDLNPLKDSLFIEGSDSPFANILATNKGDENTEWFKALEKALTSKESKAFIETKYEGRIVAAF